jgi:hypothetical protein
LNVENSSAQCGAAPARAMMNSPPFWSALLPGCPTSLLNLTLREMLPYLSADIVASAYRAGGFHRAVAPHIEQATAFREGLAARDQA